MSLDDRKVRDVEVAVSNLARALNKFSATAQQAAAGIVEIFAFMKDDPFWENYFAALDDYFVDGDGEKMIRRIQELGNLVIW